MQDISGIGAAIEMLPTDPATQPVRASFRLNLSLSATAPLPKKQEIANDLLPVGGSDNEEASG
jgi:hypothetical protein